ncbi:hypothetical protein CA951_02890 [Rhodococcus sp. NCIMB 12038]|nr:hypothetical protein CA951_02890 [Rhodococcus sp. NCIMB 12038]
MVESDPVAFRYPELVGNPLLEYGDPISHPHRGVVTIGCLHLSAHTTGEECALLQVAQVSIRVLIEACRCDMGGPVYES